MNLEKELIDFLSTPEQAERMKSVALHAMEERIKEQFKWQLPDTIAKEVNDFVTEHIAPEVRAHLIKNKGAILKSVKASADKAGEALGETLLEKVNENLDRSYKMNALLKALFE